MILRNGKVVNKPLLKKIPTHPIVFLLCGHHIGSRVIKGRVMPNPPASFSIETHYNMLTEGTLVDIHYCLSKRKLDTGRNKITKYTPESIIFEDGKIVVQPNNPDLIWFLRNHPDCETNDLYNNKAALKHRSKRFAFKEQRKGVISAQKVSEEKLENDAKGLVLNNKLNTAAIVEMYKAYGNYDTAEILSQEGGMNSLKEYLLMKAKEEPKRFIELASSSNLSLRAAIQDAKTGGLIEFHPNKDNSWSWGDETTGKVKAGGSFCKVPRGKDKEDYLDEWLRVIDDTGVLEQLMYEVGVLREIEAQTHKATQDEELAAVMGGVE